ncbi:substrate-binding domain-containing protein [Janibacter sp. GS2]|uniref:substrate-binding domain-containing protein n=1 Tax=Janibacter sp. GS2 TaxID=3442646 RepID=UPI003EB9709B
MSGEGRPGRRHDLWDDDVESRGPAGTTTPAAPETQSESATESESATGPTVEAGPTPSTGAPAPTASRRERRRAGRHTRRRRVPWWLIVVAALLVLLLCVGGAFAALGGGGDEDACGGDPITVAATPEIADPLDEALAKVKEEDACADFDVSSITAAQAAEGINEGRAPDVWIPDSSTWIDAIDADQTSGQWREGQSIASSPVALASGARSKGATTSVSSWTRLINEEGSLTMADPDVDTASRLAFHASRVGQPGRIGLKTGKRLIFMSRFAAPSVNKLFDDYSGDPTKTSPFPASEQRIATYNQDNPDRSPLRAVVPKQGTLSLDYPWITNPQLGGDVLEAADRARTELGTLEIRDSLAEAGFRDASGRRGPTVAGKAAPEVTPLEAPDRNQRLAAVEQWDLMRTDMRMLAVIDASGSMTWDSPTPGMTRWDVTKGSLLEGVDILPAGSQVGGWMFSVEEGSERNHEELAPVRPLNSAAGSGDHRDRLRRLITGGDAYLGGDTPLYDAIWDSHQKMVEDYDPDYVNSIVVFTDGENDNPNGGLSLTQLLTKLDESYDAKRPVRIITIGMGEADPTALQQISDETGGTSYIAETPDDIERVFVQALLARGRS